MNKHHLIAAGCAVLATLSGCTPSPKPQSSGERPGVIIPNANGRSSDAARTSPASDDQVLAEIDGIKLTESAFKPVLYKAAGLDVLLMIIQRDMAKAEAGKHGITISPADVNEEKRITLASAFADAKEEDYEQALRQLLAQQNVSETEFGVLMEYNAYLRALVKPVAASGLDDAAVRNEFNSLYGERVEVRDIALNNLQEFATAQRLLNDPENPKSFEEVARLMSRHPSASNGGLLPPFARTSPGYNPVFTEAAFALEPGKVSTDAIQDRGFYHILKVERRIEPTVVKYEDVKDSVREDLVRRRAAALMAGKRLELGQRALQNLRILEPTMKAEFDARVAAANPKPVEKEKLVKELNAIEEEKPESTQPTEPRDHQIAVQPPTTQPPPSQPATAPATQP